MLLSPAAASFPATVATFCISRAASAAAASTAAARTANSAAGGRPAAKRSAAAASATATATSISFRSSSSRLQQLSKTRTSSYHHLREVKSLIRMASGDSKPTVVFVLGAPGAGKGTQCKKIVQKFGYVHLSAGDLLRAERNAPGSQYGELIAGHIKNGTIVPVEITCSLLERAMESQGNGKFLIDGFPRNEDNLNGWNKQVGDKVNLKFVLFFDCSQETCVKRCLDRGAAGSGRTDDNPESLKKRFDTYIKDTMPIIHHFEKLNLVRRISSDKSVDEIFEEVQKAFE